MTPVGDALPFKMMLTQPNPCLLTVIPSQQDAANPYMLPTAETMNTMNKSQDKGGRVLQTAEEIGRRLSAGSAGKGEGRLSPKARAQSFQGKMYLVDPVEENDKKVRRLIKNRQAAKESRRKKKEFMTDMEVRVVQLEEQNMMLMNVLARYKSLYGELS